MSIYNFGGEALTATIVTDKDGMRVENQNLGYKSKHDFIRTFITDCLDMDTWKESWNIDVGRAMFNKSKERQEIRAILKDKIETRKEEIQTLKDAIQVLGRW